MEEARRGSWVVEDCAAGVLYVVEAAGEICWVVRQMVSVDLGIRGVEGYVLVDGREIIVKLEDGKDSKRKTNL